MKNEINALENKIRKASDWQEKGNLIKEAFTLSANVIKAVVPAEKHNLIDSIVDTIINNRGAGWFCDNQQGLIITTSDRKEIAKYAANWVIKAREAGLKI